MKRTYFLEYLSGRKSLLLTSLLGLSALSAQSQSLNFTPASVSSTIGTFVPLGSASTAIVVASRDDANSAPQPIGFTFNYNGQSFSQFILNVDGALKLGSTPPTDTFDDFLISTNPANNNMLFPLYEDLQAASATISFRFQTTGTAPNRVCIVQWAGMEESVNPKQFTDASFQVKLYETINTIEFVYGPFTPGIGNTKTSVSSVGLKGTGPLNGRLVLATKSAASPWAANTWQGSVYTTEKFDFNKTTLPQAGRTFRFGTAPLGTSAALGQAISVFPNPSSGFFTLDVREANAKNGLQVEVVNMLGQRVHTATVRDNVASQLDLSNVPNGMYTLKVQTGNEFSVRQVSVQK